MRLNSHSNKILYTNINSDEWFGIDNNGGIYYIDYCSGFKPHYLHPLELPFIDKSIYFTTSEIYLNDGNVVVRVSENRWKYA